MTEKRQIDVYIENLEFTARDFQRQLTATWARLGEVKLDRIKMDYGIEVGSIVIGRRRRWSRGKSVGTTGRYRVYKIFTTGMYEREGRKPRIAAKKLSKDGKEGVYMIELSDWDLEEA